MKKYRIKLDFIGTQTGKCYYKVQLFLGMFLGSESWKDLSPPVSKFKAEELLSEILSTEKEVVVLTSEIKEL